VQPFERLRAIARHGGDDAMLVAEAADCLAQLDEDPAALVVTCRRLLAHHPDCGPLWWLCARVLAAPDPSHAAWDAESAMTGDRTPDRLAGLLPFPADDPVVVLGWPPTLGHTFELRTDLEVLAVRLDDGHSWRARLARSTAGARPIDVTEVEALAPSHVLLEARTASPEKAVVAAGTADVLADLAQPGRPVWLAVAVGRLLPARLFDSMLTQASPLEDHGLELLSLQAVDRVAGPNGLDRPDRVLRRMDCPVAPELLRFA
jgi:hypothetical protein